MTDLLGVQAQRCVFALWRAAQRSQATHPQLLIQFIDGAMTDSLALAGGCGLKDASLDLGGQRREHGQHQELWDSRAKALHALIQDLASGLNLLLTREEQEDITCVGVRCHACVGVMSHNRCHTCVGERCPTCEDVCKSGAEERKQDVAHCLKFLLACPQK
jgi:hypothetical protein